MKRGIEDIILQFCPIHVFIPQFFKNDTYFFTGVSIEEAECLFTCVSIDQVSLPQTAAGKHLYCIDSTGVVFCNTYKLFILRKSNIHSLNRCLACSITNRQSRALMSMKLDSTSPPLVIHVTPPDVYTVKPFSYDRSSAIQYLFSFMLHPAKTLP